MQSDEFQDASIFAALPLDFEVLVGILRSGFVAQIGPRYECLTDHGEESGCPQQHVWFRVGFLFF